MPICLEILWPGLLELGGGSVCTFLGFWEGQGLGFRVLGLGGGL